MALRGTLIEFDPQVFTYLHYGVGTRANKVAMFRTRLLGKLSCHGQTCRISSHATEGYWPSSIRVNSGEVSSGLEVSAHYEESSRSVLFIAAHVM